MEAKRYGQGTSVAERELEAALATIPGWDTSAIGYAPITGGISNSNWRVEVEGAPCRYFVKIPGKGSELFIDRKAANEAARLAHRLGLGPAVVHFDPVTGVEVHELLEGYRACTNADFQDEAIQRQAVACYRAFNGGPPLALKKTIFDMIEEHVAQVGELDGDRPEDWPWLWSRYNRAKQAFLASGLDLVPCFNDPMPGNFLVSPGKPMQLVDHEFASTNERAYELGVWLGEMFYPEEVIEPLLEAYFGQVTPQMAARVHVMRGLADIKWATWAMVQERISALDFDYHKYGRWKYMRARAVLYDTRFERWLRLI
jgi:thiamine kinase-like enzyme